MPVINKSVMVSYTQEQMYALVNDVAHYHEFVPWCVASEVLSQDDDELHGRLTFSRGGMEKSFATLNRLQPPKMIELRLLDGPFKQFCNIRYVIALYQK